MIIWYLGFNSCSELPTGELCLILKSCLTIYICYEIG